jgi:hypothetical protein
MLLFSGKEFSPLNTVVKMSVTSQSRKRDGQRESGTLVQTWGRFIIQKTQGPK